jgi:uncharacterized protein YxjI
MGIFKRGPRPDRYQIHQQLFTFGDDFYIENQQGQRIFKVDGKVLRLRETLDFRDLDNRLLCQIQERKLRIKDVMAIDGPDGQTIAEVKKALLTPLRDRFVVNVKDAPDMDIHGNIVDHEYTIEVGHHKIAQISKKWFRVRDMYGVEVEPGQNVILILAVSVAVDMLVHPNR